MLLLERGDFYATDPFVVENFLKNKEKSVFKKHPDCCGGIKPMYIGFSRKSKFITEISNQNYNKKKITSIKNYPFILAKGSVANIFGEAVREVVRNHQ